MGTTACHAALSCRSRPAESSRPSGIDLQQYCLTHLLHCQLAFRPSQHVRETQFIKNRKGYTNTSDQTIPTLGQLAIRVTLPLCPPSPSPRSALVQQTFPWSNHLGPSSTSPLLDPEDTLDPAFRLSNPGSVSRAPSCCLSTIEASPSFRLS
jgi:hypothetical protein